MKFKVGDVCYWETEYDSSEDFIVEFCGSGKKSAELYPQHAEIRKTVKSVVVWFEGKGKKKLLCWENTKHIKKRSKLEQVLK